MRVKGVTDDDFVNYKLPSMFIAADSCSFKCDAENGTACCQNSALAKEESIELPAEWLAMRYIRNPITKAVVFGGLEPFDQYLDVFDFISVLRGWHHCDDPVVIYTGYTREEIEGYVSMLSMFTNVIIKFGRYIPGQTPHRDELLGVDLASDNQYAELIGSEVRA